MGRRGGLAAVVVVALAGSAVAAPVGPMQSAPYRWRAGFEMGLAWDRDLRSEAAGADAFEVDKRFAYLGRLSYGLFEDWEVYGRLGAATLRVEDVADGVSDASGNSGNVFDLRNEIAWGAGAKGVLRHDVVPGWDVVVDAQYFAHGRHDGRVTHGPRTGRTATRVEVEEWTAAVLFQGEYRAVEPYVGPTFGGARVRGGGLDLEADDRVGVVVGVGTEFEGWDVYVEGRFVDETAVNMGLVWTF